MGNIIKIKRGKDINLIGRAEKTIRDGASSTTYAVQPPNFKGLVPKLEVKEGDEVKAGTAIFSDKSNPNIKFTSPVSGEIAEVVRGDRRAILQVRILADTSGISYEDLGAMDPRSADRDSIVLKIQQAGLWPALRQRPYNVICDAMDVPKAIFISGFNSAPLGPETNMLFNDADLRSFQTGVNALSKLTDGKIHLSLRANEDNILSKAEGVEKHYFSGPHPAGLVGVQIHHIDPVNKGEVVWTIQPNHLVMIGRLFETGKYDASQVIAVAGSELNAPAYYKVISGCQVGSLIQDLKQDHVRVISGDVLTGTRIEKDGYLGYFDNLISVIPEGDEYEFLGWLFPTYARPTISSSLPISKFLKKQFRANTNYHGEERAYVMTGQYEKVMPMDILPVQLIKAILAKDLEKMEKLGIYEVVEEDLALCEFVCTSKMEVQQILREGLELMESES
ncbi:MAG: Na(+)-translocating NADH-quinone reductase subunit A [Flavobacteriales bacterium]|nr:Na(+)-translocating NADH-quinone reductase subunit A [Flavobacteriales bacterium]